MLLCCVAWEMGFRSCLFFLIFQLVSSRIAPAPRLQLPVKISKYSLNDSLREGLCGAAAGTAQVAGLMWLRTTMSYQHRYGLTMKEAIRDLYLQGLQSFLFFLIFKGGIPRFYKGLGFAMIQAPLAKFASVAANDLTTWMSKHSNSTSSNVALTTALGGVLAALMRVALMPIDTCKTVLQVDGTQGFQKLTSKVSAS
jgi:hypothetical protein